jgi:hypothetical protein
VPQETVKAIRDVVAVERCISRSLAGRLAWIPGRPLDGRRDEAKAPMKGIPGGTFSYPVKTHVPA